MNPHVDIGSGAELGDDFLRQFQSDELLFEEKQQHHLGEGLCDQVIIRSAKPYKNSSILPHHLQLPENASDIEN
jgi:hypothetical protein